MKSLKKVLAVVMLLCALTVLVSVNAWADTVTVNGSTNVTVGQEVTYTLSYDTDTAQSFAWSIVSGNSNIQVVTEDTALGRSITLRFINEGSAQLKAVANGHTDIEANLSITINPLVSSFHVSASSSNPTAGDSVTFSVQNPVNMDGYIYTWSITGDATMNCGSNVGNTFTVQYTGVGTSKVTATASNGTKSLSPTNTGITLTVNPLIVHPTGVSITKSTPTLVKGNSFQFEAQVLPTNATDKQIGWTSGNTDVATVDPATGMVTAVSAGTVTIYAITHDCSIPTSCSLQVTDPNTVSVSVSPATLSLASGQSGTVTATVSNTTDKTIMWSVADGSPVTLSATETQSGTMLTVTAKAVDTAKNVSIFAVSKENNAKYAECKITVNPATSSALSLSTSSLNLSVGGGDGYLQVKYNGAIIGGNYCTWECTDNSVVNVSYGTVTPKKAGTAYVRAKYNNVYSDICTVTVNASSTFFSITAVSNNSTFDGTNPLYFVTSDWYNASAVPAVTVTGANNAYSRNLVYGTDYLTESSPDGHMMVKLNPVTLHNLPQATFHNIAISNGSQIAYARFWRTGTSYNVYGVRTGDDSNVGLWSALCLVSFMGASAIVVARRKELFEK